MKSYNIIIPAKNTTQNNVYNNMYNVYLPYRRLKDDNPVYTTFLSLDDVALTAKHGATSDIVKFFDIVESQRLHMASYAIEGGSYPGHWPETPENSTQIGRFVSMIDIQTITFAINTWQCFFELNDTEYPSCCGLDVWFWHRCINSRRIQEGKMGIIDTTKIVHNPFHLSTTNGLIGIRYS
jgi:hypothetical protein